MATAAFKSTSKRPTSKSTSRNNSAQQQQQEPPRKPQNPTHKMVPRRSQSVSAFSRTHLDVTSDFNNTRDNPLFWVDGSDSPSFSNGSDKFDVVEEKFVEFSKSKGFSGDGESRRGRSVSRNCGRGERKFAGGGGDGGSGGGGRSLSRVNTGRRLRSLSRGPHCGNYESEREQESSFVSNLRSKSKIGMNRTHTLPDDTKKLVRSASDLSEVLKSSKTWSSQHPAFETSDDSVIRVPGSRALPWNDGMEVEEKTIKPVSEDGKVIQWDDSNTGGILETVCTEVRQAISNMQKDFKDAMRSSGYSNVITSGNFHDCASELASPETVELVRDFRDEFTRELEECEERARKLRAELAIEEHRELELNKILYDIVPEPETPQVEKPRLIRKASTERKKMSKRLEDEAMAYFDECVSISTFDDSDFSSLEDPPFHMVRANPGGEITNVRGIPTRDSAASYLESQDLMRQSPLKPGNEDSTLAATCSSNNSAHRSSRSSLATRSEFSYSYKLSDSTSLSQDIRNYVKNLSKDREKESSKSYVRSVPRKTAISNSETPVEKVLHDRLAFRSRIESGCMLLCDGVIGFSGAPFSSRFW